MDGDVIAYDMLTLNFARQDTMATGKVTVRENKTQVSFLSGRGVVNIVAGKDYVAALTEGV